jgi:hypothetical protein
LNWIKILFDIVALLLFTIALVNVNRLHKSVKTETNEETIRSKVKKGVPIIITLITLGMVLYIIAVFL